jgi:hypothetical protein
LFGTYITWLIVVVSLYPVCRWFWQYKIENKHKKWLKYF